MAVTCKGCSGTGIIVIKTTRGPKATKCPHCVGFAIQEPDYIWVLMQVGATTVVHYAVAQKEVPENPTDVQPIAGNKLVWAKVTLRK